MKYCGDCGREIHECNCDVTNRCTCRCDGDGTIIYCPLHKAAPELLAACERWVALHEGHMRGDCSPPGCEVCQARAAIAKAKATP